ncbi:glutamate ABC transporter substrate-binding protein [Streptomyces hoynatensis]|uniref:Glutamate ABC transporter substrate-binding protein n=1 Tax=Streptomyces hoynatensis TaxID=1141874 RepID=A0A3A9YNL9_9ACTN|nr:glutamate ABC transporter substrate-binding protein [Streptomyces hoynatensis]
MGTPGAAGAGAPGGGPGGRGGRRRVRLPRGRGLLLAAAALVLAGTTLVAALPGGGAAAGAGSAAGQAAPAGQVSSGDDLPLAGPQLCDGRPVDASLPPARDPGDAVAAIRARNQLRVGIDLNSYLWGYREPDSTRIVGFDIDLVQAIAEDLLGENPDIVYLAIPTAQRTQAIQEGTVDMVVRSMSITCDRWQDVAFSTAYFETGQQLEVPRNSSITGFDESLDGARVCSAAGSTASRLLQEQSHGAQLITQPNHLDCLVQVQLGLADALMTDTALAAGHLAQDPSMRLVGQRLTDESYGVAMNLANTDLVAWVNAVLEDYRAGGEDSQWRQSFDRWLAPYLYDGRRDPPPTPPEPEYLEGGLVD